MRCVIALAILGCAAAASHEPLDVESSRLLAGLHSRVVPDSRATAFSSAVQNKFGDSRRRFGDSRRRFGDSRRRARPGGWSGFGRCNRNCGGGTRYRSCNNPSPAHGGSACRGSNAVSCNSHNCPRHGGWSRFGNWGRCSRACNGGTQSRYRSCNSPSPAWGGRGCGYASSQTRSCNTHNCPVNCVVRGWSAWSACTRSCGGGSQTATRSLTQPRYGGTSCPASRKTQACGGGPCPIHCATSAFSSWTPCTKSCGKGSQSRKRSITRFNKNGGYVCPYLAETRSCNDNACAVDCVFDANFGAWSKCTKTCGFGSQSRTRSTRAPLVGGKACPHSAETRACNSFNCAINCAVPAFAAWSPCTLSCGTGSQQRSRATVEPKFGGVACPHSAETRACSETPCPIDGGWTDFTAWTGCSKTCDSGITFRTRTCSNPATQHGGVPCAGDAREEKPCNTHVCNCPTCSVTNGLLTIAHNTAHKDGAAGAHGPRQIHGKCQNNNAACAPTHVIAHTCRYNRDTKACACKCTKPNYTAGPGPVNAGQFRDHVVMNKNVSPLIKATATTSAADVFFSELVEGGAYTKAVELFNPTTTDIKLDGITLQWHHNGKRFTAAANPGFDMNLAGYTIGAGKTFVICRNQKPSEALKSGKCDITNASKGLNGQGQNAVGHNGDDAIEMFYNGKVIDVIGKVGEAVKCWKDANNKCLTKDVTIHRRASVRKGSTTFRPIEWDLSKKDYVANLGIHM